MIRLMATDQASRWERSFQPWRQRRPAAARAVENTVETMRELHSDSRAGVRVPGGGWSRRVRRRRK